MRGGAGRAHALGGKKKKREKEKTNTIIQKQPKYSLFSAVYCEVVYKDPSAALRLGWDRVFSRRASVRRPASSPGGSIKEPDPSLNFSLLSPFNARRWGRPERAARFSSGFLRILGEFWVEFSVFEEGSVPLLLFCTPPPPPGSV